jgi:hypothetical protein
MNKSPEQSQSSRGIWWVMWLLATVVLPAIAGDLFAKNSQLAGIFALVLGFGSLGLHLEACAKLKRKSASLHFFLLLGGWGLMTVSYFYGCAAGYSPLM